MSMSKEHYVARLAALRDLCKDIKRMHDSINRTASDEYIRGVRNGFYNAHEQALCHVRSVQYRLRRICNVTKKSDLIFGR